MILGQDIGILFKLSLQKNTQILSKQLAEDLFLLPSEVTKSLRRCRDAGLLYWSDAEKRVNRAGLLEFLAHGLKYVFPAERGGMVRGIPTSISTEPLQAHFQVAADPPQVWPYAEGTVRGNSFKPLFKQAPQASLRDSELYALLALADAVRSGRVRERTFAVEELTKRLNHYA
jgi:hypothetical protein